MQRLSYVVPSACGLALLVGGMVALNPVFENNAVFAVDKETTETDVTNDGNIMVMADPTINLTIGGVENGMATTVTSVGTITPRENTVTVGGTGISRYALTISTAVGSTGELVGKSNPSVTVGKVGAGTAYNSFPDNTWGYAVSPNAGATNDSLVYNPVPAGGDATYLAVKAGAPATGGDIYKLVFAAKLGASMPADHYQTNVYVSAVANSADIANLGFTGGGKTITTMQEMTSTICSGGTEGEQRRLVDNRDGKIYWVAKLVGGDCWMTQNLDFDVPATLSNASSNVSGVSVITDVIRVEVIDDWSGRGGTYNAYYDPGNFIYNGPSGTYHSQGTACTNASTSLGLLLCGQFSQVTASTLEEDLHYHVGNYYSYSAATVKSGDTLTSGNAGRSICPKGWKLPTSNNANKGSFAYLLTQYGVHSSPTSGSNAIYKEPLYFVYGGYLNGILNYAGNSGDYWSSTPYSNTANAYRLIFASSVYPSANDGNRYLGMSVRCVAE